MDKNYDFFMKTDVDSYVGQWIAICDQRIISHDRDVKKVFKEAKEKCPLKTPFIAKIPEKGTMIF